TRVWTRPIEPNQYVPGRIRRDGRVEVIEIRVEPGPLRDHLAGRIAQDGDPDGIRADGKRRRPSGIHGDGADHVDQVADLVHGCGEPMVNRVDRLRAVGLPGVAWERIRLNIDDAGRPEAGVRLCRCSNLCAIDLTEDIHQCSTHYCQIHCCERGVVCSRIEVCRRLDVPAQVEAGVDEGRRVVERREGQQQVGLRNRRHCRALKVESGPGVDVYRPDVYPVGIHSESRVEGESSAAGVGDGFPGTERVICVRPGEEHPVPGIDADWSIGQFDYEPTIGEWVVGDVRLKGAAGGRGQNYSKAAPEISVEFEVLESPVLLESDHSAGHDLDIVVGPGCPAVSERRAVRRRLYAADEGADRDCWDDPRLEGFEPKGDSRVTTTMEDRGIVIVEHRVSPQMSAWRPGEAGRPAEEVREAPR